MSDRLWVHLSDDPNYRLFAGYEATWHAPELAPDNFRPSPLIPGATWVMAPKVFAWLEPRLEPLGVFSRCEGFQREDRITVLSPGVPVVVGHLFLEQKKLASWDPDRTVLEPRRPWWKRLLRLK